MPFSAKLSLVGRQRRAAVPQGGLQSVDARERAAPGDFDKAMALRRALSRLASLWSLMTLAGLLTLLLISTIAGWLAGKIHRAIASTWFVRSSSALSVIVCSASVG
jgi:hypothetical protein